MADDFQVGRVVPTETFNAKLLMWMVMKADAEKHQFWRLV